MDSSLKRIQFSVCGCSAFKNRHGRLIFGEIGQVKQYTPHFFSVEIGLEFCYRISERKIHLSSQEIEEMMLEMIQAGLSLTEKDVTIKKVGVPFLPLEIIQASVEDQVSYLLSLFGKKVAEETFQSPPSSLPN
ncbi:MAG TPA: hypothetical protein PKY08_00655 [Candidatus Magasanikbacteria bacterium]|nr:hypothetical protein [Candidatus Magasanikbacteria bacterium]